MGQLALDRYPCLCIFTDSGIPFNRDQGADPSLCHITAGLSDRFNRLIQNFLLGFCSSCINIPATDLLKSPPEFRLKQNHDDQKTPSDCLVGEILHCLQIEDTAEQPNDKYNHNTLQELYRFGTSYKHDQFIQNIPDESNICTD